MPHTAHQIHLSNSPISRHTSTRQHSTCRGLLTVLIDMGSSNLHMAAGGGGVASHIRRGFVLYKRGFCFCTLQNGTVIQEIEDNSNSNSSACPSNFCSVLCTVFSCAWHVCELHDTLCGTLFQKIRKRKSSSFEPFPCVRPTANWRYLAPCTSHTTTHNTLNPSMAKDMACLCIEICTLFLPPQKAPWKMKQFCFSA